MQLRVALLLGVSAALFAADERPSFYLPDGVRPIEYRLDLRIDPREPVFTGTVRIAVEAAAPAPALWLNSSAIRVQRATLDGRAVRTESIDDQFLAIQTPIAAGRHAVEISYEASFQERPVGAYRRKAGDDWYVYTTFTAIEARRAIPCFDEPRFKTPWTISIAAPDGMVAVSNAPDEASRGDGAGWKRVQFRPTPPLPSEIVAFAVGPFDVFDGGLAGRKRIPVRVLTVRGRGADGKPAAEATDSILRALEDYTGMAYPWDKLDHLALVEGAYGAVENPGLITYRQRALLAPGSDRARLAMRGLMAHELAHQWFGNLVTQADWDDVWLSEGFAEWLGLKIADLDQPPARHGFSFVLAKQAMMARDNGSRPVRKHMTSARDMDDVYARVVYVKGAAALAALEQRMGEQGLRRGLQRYLARHRFGCARTTDLIEDIRAETGIGATRLLASILDNAGVPEVRIEECDRSREMPACVSADGWTFADAGGAGYYWAHPPSRGQVDPRRLTPPERASFVLRELADLPLM